MKISIENWSISELIEKKELINPKPQYQRTSVWLLPKKKLLIDSILRGYDIPKFYLRQTPLDPVYDYEITDGQQRMRSIWEFIDGEYALNEAEINGFNTKAIDYPQLSSITKIHNSFLDYTINIALIREADLDEIRSLFARLQMGEKLNPAELRHALASNIGNIINSIVENHSFFKVDCKIPNNRYKHQDYLDNALTLSVYDANRSIKAIDIRHLYVEYGNKLLDDLQPLMERTNNILNSMEKINSFKKGIFKNKWAFVDIFYLLYKQYDNYSIVKPKLLAENLWSFELLRKSNNPNPEKLIEDKTSLIYDKDLYDYIIAFKSEGADKNNTKIRYRVMYNKFFNSNNFEIKLP
jgi:hypothetical protein